MDYKQPGGFGYLLGCVLVFFFFSFSVLFVFGRASARTSESFSDDYGSGCKDIGFAFLVQGFCARID